MATIVTRETTQTDGTSPKGSPLTNAEVDTNFINLNDDKVEVSGAIIFQAKAGEALAKGDVVYVSGVSGNEPIVSKADADDASKMPAYGLAEDAANLNAAVNVVTFGTLYDLNTSGFSAGDTVYVSTTAGALTNSAPTGESSLIQNIGMVVRSHASAGSIKVGGAGRTNATPNLNDGNVFIGNASNQAAARALTTSDIASGTFADARIAQSNVTQHQAALSITESQISDLQAYLTAESDTLDSVTGRGATTTNAVTVGNLTSTGIDDNAVSTAITIDSSQDVTFTSDAKFPDNGKAIFGAGSDLEIYHNATDSVIADVGTGNLKILANDLRINNADSSKSYITGFNGAQVYLYHNGSPKLETTSTGIDVTGSVVSDGLTVDTSTLVVDAVNNRVGVGTAAPQELLHLRKDASAVVAVKAQNNTTNGIMEYQAGNDADNWFFGIDASDNFGISDVTGQASQRLVITQAGNVGIGTTTVNADLHLGAASPHIDIGPAAGNRGKVGFDSNNVYIGSSSGTGEIHFKNNIGSTDAPHSSGDTKMVIADNSVTINENTNILSTLTLGSNPSDPGTLLINDNSTTAYTLALKGTGTRQYALEGSASGSNYSLILSNASAAGGFHFTTYGAATFNENGDNWDFRVESDTNTHALFVDASLGRIGLFESSPPQHVTLGGGRIFEWRTGSQAMFRPSNNTNDHRIVALTDQGMDVVWGGATTISMQKWKNGSEVVFNDDSNNQDFRVETDNNSFGLFVDAGNDRIGINTGSPESTLCVNGDILAPWGNSGSVNIGIATRVSNLFSSTSKDLIIKGAGAVVGPQAMQGGNVYVQGGLGAGNEGLNIYAGHLYLEGGNHTSGAGTEAGAGKIFMKTAGYERLNISQYGLVTINEAGRDCDFRVESDANSSALYVDAGNNVAGTNVPFQLGAIGNGTNAQIFNSKSLSVNTATDIFSVDMPSGAFACYIDVMQVQTSGYAGRTAQYLWYARRATAGNHRAVVELSNNSLGSVNAGVIPVATFTATAVTSGTYTEKFQFTSTRSDPIYFVLRVVGSYATSITPV